MPVSRLLYVVAPGLVLTALFIGGCDDSNPTSPRPATLESTTEGSAASAHLSTERPFRVSADAVLLGQEFAPGFGPPDFGRSDFDGRCSAPSDFVVSFALEGSAIHLGTFTAIAEHCSVVDFSTGASSITDGVMILTAANGDELWANYTRPTASEEVPENFEFVGGTGRFAGASGEGLGHPDCDRATGTCTFDLEGVIVYDASDRAD